VRCRPTPARTAIASSRRPLLGPFSWLVEHQIGHWASRHASRHSWLTPVPLVQSDPHWRLPPLGLDAGRISNHAPDPGTPTRCSGIQGDRDTALGTSPETSPRGEPVLDPSVWSLDPPPFRPIPSYNHWLPTLLHLTSLLPPNCRIFSRPAPRVDYQFDTPHSEHQRQSFSPPYHPPPCRQDLR
jgi:hypothetical protein